MEKTYSPAIEATIYATWEQNGYFKAQGTGTPYCIMLPPPNVTGSLHMGHAFQHTLMDILIRTHRMQGDNTLWQVGTDHAGIATQMVVENQLFKENKSRYDLGREPFIARVWQWKAESGGTITGQMRRLGTSGDFSRERFTMDEGLSQAVQTAFIKLYDDGLIYRGKRLVNWDPSFKTAVSDLEVVHSEENGMLYYIRYPVAGSDEAITVATSRPETLFGDVAVAVHPEDERYRHLIGKKLLLPLTTREIPIIADDQVLMEFGSGAVKITPAHDFNDYEMSKRHQLPMINIFTLDAHLNDEVPAIYRGLERFAARKKAISDLKEQGLLVDTKAYQVKIPRNERGNQILEPMLTDQWYVSMAKLAAPALEKVRCGEINFIPNEWKNTYFQWLENIQDWCISRQLWWGHRIPAWYDREGNLYVGENESVVRRKYQLANDVQLVQDEDVLDTWFSSALWPFSTLGWPQNTPELKTFYPTSVLITGFDIIFFWVARMIMFGLYFMNTIPFRDIYITGLIRDQDGQKMSKTKGNVIDPVDLIDGIDLDSLIKKRTSSMMQESLKEKAIQATKKQFPEGIAPYGTDALRFTFCALASTSRDICFDIKRLEGYRNFCNKLWNASRFVLMNIENQEISSQPANGQSRVIHDYFNARLNAAIEAAHHHTKSYRFDLLAQTLYEFVWQDYCDWYLELSKVILQGTIFSDAEKAYTRYQLLHVLDEMLRLLHPIIPFISEEIWQNIKVPLKLKGNTLMLAAYPNVKAEELQDFPAIEWLKTLIVELRTLRAVNQIAPGQVLSLQHESNEAARQYLQEFAPFIQSLGRVKDTAMVNAAPALAASFLVNGITFYVPLSELIDKDKERARLGKELQNIENEIKRLNGKLTNPSFVDKAPGDVVAKEKAKLADYEVQRVKLAENLKILG